MKRAGTRNICIFLLGLRLMNASRKILLLKNTPITNAEIDVNITRLIESESGF